MPITNNSLLVLSSYSAGFKLLDVALTWEVCLVTSSSSSVPRPPSVWRLLKYWQQPADRPRSPGRAAPPWAAAGCSSPRLLQEAVQRSFCPWCWRFGWIYPGCWTARGCRVSCEAAVTLIESPLLPCSGDLSWLRVTVNVSLQAPGCWSGGGGEGSKVRLYVFLTKSMKRTYLSVFSGPWLQAFGWVSHGAGI